MCFVRSLGEVMAGQFCFEMNWPLAVNKKISGIIWDIFHASILRILVLKLHKWIWHLYSQFFSKKARTPTREPLEGELVTCWLGWLWSQFYRQWVYKTPLCITGKSFSEALIHATTNTQYDKRLFIDLQVQYMKITCSEHVVYINCFLFLFWHA